MPTKHKKLLLGIAIGATAVWLFKGSKAHAKLAG